MPVSITIYRGSVALSDGANATLNGFPLAEAQHALEVFARANAAQMAVLDLATKATSLSLQITRQFDTEAEARDHALRAPNIGTGQHNLVIVMDDGTDVHTWTLSDQDEGGAAWKGARVLYTTGARTAIEYTVEGGAWTYTGPLAGTYSDATPDAAANSETMNVVNALLARVSLGASVKIELPSTVFAGAMRYPGTALAGILKNSANTEIGSFTADSLTSLAGTLYLYGCTSLTSLSLPALASLTGTLECGLCTSLAEVTLPASIATANGFRAAFNGCVLDVATVDAILAAFADGIGSTVSGYLLLDGSGNASPTGGASNADYLTLTGAGITVSIH